MPVEKAADGKLSLPSRDEYKIFKRQTVIEMACNNRPCIEIYRGGNLRYVSLHHWTTKFTTKFSPPAMADSNNKWEWHSKMNVERKKGAHTDTPWMPTGHMTWTVRINVCVLNEHGTNKTIDRLSSVHTDMLLTQLSPPSCSRSIDRGLRFLLATTIEMDRVVCPLVARSCNLVNSERHRSATEAS
jgi:hypothetical protein